MGYPVEIQFIHYSVFRLRSFLQLTIRLRAQDLNEVIVNEGEAPINYHLIEIENE